MARSCGRRGLLPPGDPGVARGSRRFSTKGTPVTVLGAAPRIADAYEAKSADERHLAELLKKLPEMQRVHERLEWHREAMRLCAKFQAVDDLGEAIDGLEGCAPLDTPEGRRLYEVLLGEKRAAYRDEKARLDHDVERSRWFSSIAQASAARLAPAELAELESELNRFREDYALTLAKCRGEGASC